MKSDGGWGLLRHELYRRRSGVARVLAWSIVEALPALLSGWLVAMAADRGFLAGRPWAGLGWLAVYGCCHLVRTIATWQLLPRLADVVEPLRDSLVETVVAGTLRQAVRGGDRLDTSALARLTEQIQSIRGLVSTLMLEVRRVVVSVVVAVVGLAFLAPVLALLAIVPVVACMAVFVRLQRGLRARRHAAIVADELIARDAGEVLDGMRDVVACGAEGRVAASLGTAIDAQAGAERRLAGMEARRLVVMAAGESLPILAVLLAAPWLIHTHDLTTGQILGAVTYLVSSLQPALSSLLGTVGGLGLQLGVILDRIARLAAIPQARAAVLPGGGTRPDDFTLQAWHLTFAYGLHAKPVVQDLTLTIEEGEHLAIVGPSGIGKSTLAHLLTGITRPQQGEIRLGGVSLDDVDDGYLHRVVALIPQEAYVFTGTLRDNLRYLAAEATDSELDRAVDAVGLRSLVERLGGYDAEIGAGRVVLSTGERQLIALTRVHLSPARVVILDEGTSQLDPVAEAKAEQAFRDRGGTLIVIAHRISSALRADRVLVLDGRGPVAGTHDVLLATSPLYRELVAYWTGAEPASCRWDRNGRGAPAAACP